MEITTKGGIQYINFKQTKQYNRMDDFTDGKSENNLKNNEFSVYCTCVEDTVKATECNKCTDFNKGCRYGKRN